MVFVLAQPRDEITVTMPDGSERKAKCWETSPMDVAKEVSKSLSERIVIAKVHFLFSYASLKRPFSHSFIMYSRWMANCGIWNGHLKSLASSSYLILNTQKVSADLSFLKE